MINPKFLILAGDGINCERETSFALNHTGIDCDIVHINDVTKYPKTILKYDGMILPGGFSFADELGSGKVLALKIENYFKEEFFSFVDLKRPILGICNGFQTLAHLGVFGIDMVLENNSRGTFIDKWCELEVMTNSVCCWTKSIPAANIHLPIRHGEGRVVLNDEVSSYSSLVKNGQIALKYRTDVNGSYEQVSGICDKSGLVLGMMPHPECAISPLTSMKINGVARNDGVTIFESIKNYLRNC